MPFSILGLLVSLPRIFSQHKVVKRLLRGSRYSRHRLESINLHTDWKFRVNFLKLVA